MNDGSPIPKASKVGSDEQTAENATGNKECGNGKDILEVTDSKTRRRSRFPVSKRIEFLSSLGLVLWVGTEMFESHDAKKLIVLAIIVALFWGVVCHAICKITKSRFIGVCIWIAGTLFAGNLAHRNALFPAFKIIPREEYTETKTPRYFLNWNYGGTPILTPINVRMFVQFTNLRDKDLTINSYQFEGQLSNNTWAMMRTIDPGFGHITCFYGTNWGPHGYGIGIVFPEGTMLAEMPSKWDFPGVLNGKSIAPGELIAGEVFLEAPTNSGFDGLMRLTIKDTTDNEFTENVAPYQQYRYLETTVQANYGRGLQLPEDPAVRKYKVVRYSDIWR